MKFRTIILMISCVSSFANAQTIKVLGKDIRNKNEVLIHCNAFSPKNPFNGWDIGARYAPVSIAVNPFLNAEIRLNEIVSGFSVTLTDKRTQNPVTLSSELPLSNENPLQRLTYGSEFDISCLRHFPSGD